MTHDNLRSIGTADAGFVIPHNRQGGSISRFLVGQSGGYDPQYYTSGEAKATTVLAAAKFASVSLATYSFMKAVSPAFDNQAITSLPSMAGTDAKHLLMGASAAALWWGISKLDTAVMHNMRAQKAAKYALNHFGVENPDALKRNFAGLMFRFGISAGSLGITVPALLATSSEATIDKYIQDKIYNDNNSEIVEMYQGRLATVESEIERLTGLRVQFDQDILGITTDARQMTYTEEQTTRLAFLRSRLQALEAQKAEQQQRQEEEERTRDAAQSRMEQERVGTRGSVAGEGPLFLEAQGDRDDANRRLETINAALTRINGDIGTVQGEMDGIENAARAANNAQIAANQRLLEDLRRQKEETQTALDAQITERERVQDVNGLASADPRFIHFNPDMTERLDAYVEYMQNEANPMEWSWAAFVAIMIASMELGVFALSASRNANPGEVRGYMADMVKSREAAGEFSKSMMRMHLQGEAHMEGEKVAHGKKKYVLAEDEALFKETLEKAKNDPEFREKVLKDIMVMFEQHRLKNEDGHDADDIAMGGVDPHKLNGSSELRSNGRSAEPGPA